jgi:hypothetical protein
VSKDRAAPFSRKHRRYWIPVTGGMILIGLINIVIGFMSYDPPSQKTEQMDLVIPKLDAGAQRAPDNVDAGSDVSPSR